MRTQRREWMPPACQVRQSLEPGGGEGARQSGRNQNSWRKEKVKRDSVDEGHYLWCWFWLSFMAPNVWVCFWEFVTPMRGLCLRGGFQRPHLRGYGQMHRNGWDYQRAEKRGQKHNIQWSPATTEQPGRWGVWKPRKYRVSRRKHHVLFYNDDHCLKSDCAIAVESTELDCWDQILDLPQVIQSLFPSFHTEKSRCE